MSHGSLYTEFHRARHAGRAWLQPSAAKWYPHLRQDTWYHVWDMGADEYGFYLDLEGAARYVYRHHLEYEGPKG